MIPRSRAKDQTSQGIRGAGGWFAPARRVLGDHPELDISSYIAADFEPGGLRGPSMVAQELANVSLVSAAWWWWWWWGRGGKVAADSSEMDSVIAQPSTTSTPTTHSPHHVCWDFYHAAKQGFVALADEADAHLKQRARRSVRPRLLPGKQGWEFWDRVVWDPASLSHPELQGAARTLGFKVRGVDGVVVGRLRAARGLGGGAAFMMRYAAHS